MAVTISLTDGGLVVLGWLAFVAIVFLREHLKVTAAGFAPAPAPTRAAAGPSLGRR